jgi:hypothetical protein
MNTNIYVGIDNGISGALAAIIDGGVLSMPMPIQKARKGNEIDIEGVDEWITQLLPLGRVQIIVEEPGGSKSAQAAASMAGSFHALRALCVARAWRWHRITPQRWQKVMLPGCKAGETKERALAAARALWPHKSWLATERCRVPHDGMVDAALIAEWGRLQQL